MNLLVCLLGFSICDTFIKSFSFDNVFISKGIIHSKTLYLNSELINQEIKIGDSIIYKLENVNENNFIKISYSPMIPLDFQINFLRKDKVYYVEISNEILTVPKVYGQIHFNIVLGERIFMLDREIWKLLSMVPIVILATFLISNWIMSHQNVVAKNKDR